MSRKFILYSVTAALILGSCGHSKVKSDELTGFNGNAIKQHEDGTISLTLASADCYSDVNNPSCNTAEWDVVVSKSGRYNVWLSSATKDTNDLRYKNSVMISVQDNRIIARPGCDRIIYNSLDVNYPWFRADSFLGAMFIQDTGVFHIQVNSEQILPEEYNRAKVTKEDLSKLISISFKPATR
jgi:hypothetical protein